MLPTVFNPIVKNLNTLTIDAFVVYARALHNIIQRNCPDVFQRQPIPNDCITPDLLFNTIVALDTVSSNGRHIKFKPNGDAVDIVSYIEFEVRRSGRSVRNIGTFNEDYVALNQNESFWVREPQLAPEFIDCVEKCKVEEIKIVHEIACCFTCWKCRNNEVKNGNATKCIPCPINFWPDMATRSVCYPLTPKYITTKDTVFLAITASAGGGGLLTLCVLLFFWIHRDKKLLKATSIPTSIALLLAIAIVFSQSIFYLLPPNQLICTAKLVFFHLTYSLVYGLLLIKLLRIYLIFRAANNFTKAANLGNSSQFVGMLIIVLIQVS